MPEALTINGGETKGFDKEIREIAVGVGSIIVTKKVVVDENETEVQTKPKSEVVEADEIYKGEDTAALVIYSPDGARIGVTYTDEPRENLVEPEAISSSSGAKRSKK